MKYQTPAPAKASLLFVFFTFAAMEAKDDAGIAFAFGFRAALATGAPRAGSAFFFAAALPAAFGKPRAGNAFAFMGLGAMDSLDAAFLSAGAALSTASFEAALRGGAATESGAALRSGASGATL